MPALTFRADCPDGHPDARWTLNPPDTAAVRAEHFTITCRGCEPPPPVVIHNPRPRPFRPPWRAA